MVYNWIKETGLVNLSRSRICVGVGDKHEYIRERGYGGNVLHILLIFVLGYLRKAESHLEKALPLL